MDSKTMKARRGMTKTLRRIVNKANRNRNYLLAAAVAEGQVSIEWARSALRGLPSTGQRSPFRYPR